MRISRTLEIWQTTTNKISMTNSSSSVKIKKKLTTLIMQRSRFIAIASPIIILEDHQTTLKDQSVLKPILQLSFPANPSFRAVNQEERMNLRMS
jgi:hypothetical protein